MPWDLHPQSTQLQRTQEQVPAGGRSRAGSSETEELGGRDQGKREVAVHTEGPRETGMVGQSRLEKEEEGAKQEAESGKERREEGEEGGREGRKQNQHGQVANSKHLWGCSNSKAATSQSQGKSLDDTGLFWHEKSVSTKRVYTYSLKVGVFLQFAHFHYKKLKSYQFLTFLQRSPCFHVWKEKILFQLQKLIPLSRPEMK